MTAPQRSTRLKNPLGIHTSACTRGGQLIAHHSEAARALLARHR